jgi:tungstate transport system substrate-binding protein
MIHRTGALAALLLCAHAPLAVAQQPRDMILATTTSTQDSGLLDSILPVFQRETGIRVKVIAVGTGAALEMARSGDADAVLVHAPAAEQKYVESGDLAQGRLVMHNDFLLVGPAGDPAGVKGMRDPARALAQLAGKETTVVSRGDGSGTEKKEMELWRGAGINPDSVSRRVETGQGMGATLLVAEQRQAYTLTDRATYLAFGKRLTLQPMVEGAPSLLNIYHVYVVNPAKHSRVKLPEARAFAAFMVAPSTQASIGAFGRSRFGEPLFFPDAGKDTASLGRSGRTDERSGAGVR